MMTNKVFSFGWRRISHPFFTVSYNSPFSVRFRTDSVEIRNSRHSSELELNSVNDCVSLYNEMRRMRHLTSIFQFTQLLSRLVKLEEYSSAICVFRDLCSLGIPIDEYTLNIAINSYCLSKRVDFGFSILGSFFKRGCVPNAFTFSTLLGGLFRENRSDEAIDLFRKIVQGRLCEINVVMYGTVLNGICKTGHVAEAMELLQIMGKGSCKPNTHIYSMLIDALCKNNLVDSALELFAEMSEKGIRADVVTYSALICGLCSLSRWGEVDVLLKEMVSRKVYPDVITYTTILQALFRAGRCSDASKLFEEMQASGIIPDPLAYSILLDGLCRNGHSKEALLILNEVEQKRKDLHTTKYYNILMNGFCKDKELDMAQGIFGYLGSKGLEPDVVSYSILIKGCFEDGLLEEAKDLVLRMKQADVLPDGITYNCIAQACLRSGEHDDATKFLEEMTERGFSPDPNTLALMLDLPGTVENNPTLLKCFKRWI